MTATGRRLDHLEEGLPPKEAFLLWLTEAYAHGSSVAYAASLVDRPFAESPLVRLHEQAVREVRRRLGGGPVWQRIDAEEQADLDIAFLFELVMSVEISADETCRVGGLRYGMLFWEGRAINAERHLRENAEPGASQPTIAGRREDWRDAVAAFRADLAVQAEVRRGLENRYLDGHVAVFPETLERWQRLHEAVEGLPFLGPPEGPTVDPEPDAGWVVAETEHILRWARVRALDLNGDTDAAMAIAEPLLRLPRATADPWPVREGPPSRGAARSDGSRS